MTRISKSTNENWKPTKEVVFRRTPWWQKAAAHGMAGISALALPIVEYVAGWYTPEMVDSVARMGNSTAQKIVEYMGPVGSTEEFAVRCAGLVLATGATFATIGGISSALDAAHAKENEMERNATSVEV